MDGRDCIDANLHRLVRTHASRQRAQPAKGSKERLAEAIFGLAPLGFRKEERRDRDW